MSRAKSMGGHKTWMSQVMASWWRAGTHSPLPLSHTMFLKVEHTTWTCPCAISGFPGLCPVLSRSVHFLSESWDTAWVWYYTPTLFSHIGTILIPRWIGISCGKQWPELMDGHDSWMSLWGWMFYGLPFQNKRRLNVLTSKRRAWVW